MKRELPLVSVIIPCYNAEQYVEVAVRSVMKQSYINLEVITIDDCSTDNTLSILKKLASEDNRIVLLCNNKNLGLVSTLNKGIYMAKGKYIARMDADDISVFDRIDKQVNFLEENRGVALCGSNYLVIDEKGRQIGKIIFPSEDATIKAELLFMNPFAHPTVMMKKETLEKCGFYEEGMVPAEDYELWVRIAKDHRVANIPDYLLKYRVHGNNITITQRENQKHVLQKILNKYVVSFGYADAFVNYHFKFLCGAWSRKSSIDEINGFKQWEKALVEKNLKLGLASKSILKKCFAKYYSNALLSIIKSNENTYRLKLQALLKLLLINPLVTMKHFTKKIA